MEIVWVVVLVVLAVPVGLLYALYRIGQLSTTVDELRREISTLRRDAAREQGRPGRAGTGPRPRHPDEARRAAAEAAEEEAPPTTGPVREPTGEGRAQPPRPGPAPSSSGTRSEAPSPERPTASRAKKPSPASAGMSGSSRPADPTAPSAPSGLDVEAAIGTTWLLRIGLGILAIALALFARLVAPQLSPPAKVGVAYAAAVALFAVGRFFEDRLDRFAKPVMAGGLAFGFFVAFAAHFVPAMHAVSLPVSIGWMAASMLTVLVAAERWRSESTAILAVVLGHVSAQASAGAADMYSLVMIGFLAATALALLLRHGWIQLGLVGVAASYGAHLLWMLAERQPPAGDEGFWLSLAFLTSYYAIFLVADLLWWRRARTLPDDDLDAGRRRAARALGPSNLVLYVSLATFVYLMTEGRVASIEWYYLTLGALQGALAWLYRDLSHRDFVYYPVFGTVLWTIGLFAALDALVLNLVLASHALLLLLAARRTGLRVLYLLSQAMMGAAFVHYFLYPPPEPGLGVFVGGVAVASVYLLKSVLEDDWYRLPFLPQLHAILGGIVLLQETTAYLAPDAGWGLFLAATAVALTLVVRWRPRPTLLFAVSTLALGPLTAAGRVGTDALWLACTGVLVAAILQIHTVVDRVEGSERGQAVWHARAAGLLVLLGAFLSVTALEPSLETYLLWMLVPLGLVVTQLGVDRFTGPEGHPDRLALVVYVSVGLLVVALTGETTTRLMQPIWSWIWASAAFGALALHDRRGLPVLGYTLLFGGALAFLNLSLLVAPDVPPERHPALGTVWAAALLVAAPMAIGWGMDRRLGATPFDAALTEPDKAADLLAALAPYLLGLLVAGAVAAELASLGWIYLAPALVGAALLMAGRPSGMKTPALAAILGAGAWHLHFLTVGARAPGAEGALIPLLAFSVVTLAVERGATAELDVDEDDGVLGPFLPGLVVVATLTGMAAVYLSEPLGGAWTTVGWSVWAGGLMAAAFLLRSAVHRRVALGVLGICIVRVFAVDTVGLSDTARIGAFLILGLVLVGIALLYNRYSEELKGWL